MILDRLLVQSATHADMAFSGSLGLVTALTVIAVTAAVVAATVSVIQAFQAPKPSKISFGAVGENAGPRYGSFGPLDNTVSNELAIPVLYGQLKLAGNVIWQTDPGETVGRIIGLAEGQVNAIYDVRANDNQISTSNTPGSSYTAYRGTNTQEADSRVPAALRPDLALKRLAYVALTLAVGEKIKGGNPTITSIVQGLLIETWTGSAWNTTKVYSRNPAAAVRDFLLNARYGLGVPKANLNEASFGEVYEYCEAMVSPSEAYTSDAASKLLLHFDATPFADSSGTPKTISSNGASLDTTRQRFGAGCAQLTGLDAYIEAASHADFAVGTGDFTIEGWMQLLAHDRESYVFQIAGGTNNFLSWHTAAGGRLDLAIGTTTISVEYPTALSEWIHFAVVRASGTLKLYINGKEKGTASDTTNIAAGAFRLGNNATDARFGFDGLFEEVRFSNTARWTANFAPPQEDDFRFRLDYVLDNQRPAEDHLNDMLATFGGFLVYSGSKIKLRVEKAESVTQYFGDGSTTAQNATFDPSNIVKDSFSWNLPSVDDRPNRVKIQWVDPDQNYVKVYTQTDDRIDQDDRGGIVVTKEIALLGITRSRQASRMAKLFMAKAKYAAANVQFSARLESINCEVGDVVAVTHQAARWTRKLMRITNMQEAEDETIRFTCTEYNASLYDDHGGPVVVIQQPTGPNLYSPLADVSGLSLLEDNFKNKDGTFVTNITASWTAIPDDQLLRLDRQLIQLSEDGGNSFRDVAFVSPEKTSYKIVLGNVNSTVTFRVRIKTISDRGAESSGATGDITIAGKSTPPGDVEDFGAELASDHIVLTWTAVDDEDLYAYEIRVGNGQSTWETAAIVTSEYSGTRYEIFNITRGEKRYFIKAIDNSGNYSENAAMDSVTISEIPRSNVVANFDVFSRITHPERHPQFGQITKTNSLSAIVSTGGAAQLDGATKYLIVQNASSLNISTGDFTIEAFINLDSIATFMGIASHGVGNGAKWQWCFRGDLSPKRFQFFAQDAGAATLVDVAANYTPAVRTWYHVAVTRASGVYRFFVNGTLIGSGTDTTDISSPADIADTLNIGYARSGASTHRFLHGKIDQFVLNNRIAWWTADFDTLESEDGVFRPWDVEDDDVCHIQFDEMTGFTSFDLGANGNNAVWNTTPNWQGGIVGVVNERLKPRIDNLFDPAYNRVVLEPLQVWTFDEIQHDIGTYLTLQDEGGDGFGYSMVFGEEIYVDEENYYTTAPFDLGGVVAGRFVLDFQTNSTVNLGVFVVQIATSTDGVTYEDFVNFVNGAVYTARYVKFRFLMNAMSPIRFDRRVNKTIVRFISAYLTVDAPDREQNFLNQTIGAGGSTVSLDGFASVKSIVLTTVGTSNLTPRIHDQSNLPVSFDVRLFDTAGNLQAGAVNIYVKGY